MKTGSKMGYGGKADKSSGSPKGNADKSVGGTGKMNPYERSKGKPC